MDVGIFAKIFKRATLAETLDAIRAHGISAVQFNMACAGLPTLPEQIDPALIEGIRQAMDARGLTMVAISGTYNMIHPDPAQRADGLTPPGCVDAGVSRVGYTDHHTVHRHARCHQYVAQAPR